MEYTLLNYEGFEQYLVDSNVYCNGFCYEFQFENNYGASVIKHNYSYGNENDLFELAVLDNDGKLTFDTSITNDVLGWLTNEEVIEYFKAIQLL